MRRTLVLTVPLAAIVLALVATGCGSTGAKANRAPVVHKCSFYPKAQKKPQSCTTSNGPCSEFSLANKPAACLSTAQFVLQRKASKRSAAAARVAARRAARQARAQAKAAEAAAKRAAAARAAANRWHRGYSYWANTDNGRVFYMWVSNPSCADYATSGCAKVKLAAEHGCSSLFVESNEQRSGTIVGNAIASQDNIPAHTPVLLELDADTSQFDHYSAPKITCYP